MSEQDQSQTEDIIIPADDADQNDDHAEQHGDASTEPQEGEGQADDDAVVVTIGDEQPPEEEQHAQAPAWVKELRKSQRELQRENRELKAKLQQGAASQAEPAIVLGKKPTLEDHDYDAELFEQSLADCYEKKRQVDAQAEQARKAQEAQQAAWQESSTATRPPRLRSRCPTTRTPSTSQPKPSASRSRASCCRVPTTPR